MCGALVDTEPPAETLPFAPDTDVPEVVVVTPPVFVTVFGEVVLVTLCAGAIASPIPKNTTAISRGTIVLSPSAEFARTVSPANY